ncbi:hypothetical protein ACWCV2_17030 [Streptomyces pseudogriseolus]|uniref:hypothetical protein n=1 Tax=Streptomyces pseudogriseolus TaxID=36817 RepID=UPI003FA29288
MTATPQGRDWTRMKRTDFDDSAPLALVDAADVGRPVPAVPDECGTEPLFGEPAQPKGKARTRRPAATVTEDDVTLF